jgi:hypothetical protein
MQEPVPPWQVNHLQRNEPLLILKNFLSPMRSVFDLRGYNLVERRVEPWTGDGIIKFRLP